MSDYPVDPTGSIPTESVPPPAQPVYNPPPPSASAGGLSDNMAGALAYLTFIPAILFLVLEPYNKSPFIRFHSVQSIAFAVVAFGCHIVLIFIPIIGWLISLVLTVVFFVFWLMAILKASKGEWYKLPIIGDFAMQQSKQ